MTPSFMHIGKFSIDPNKRDAFVEVMKDYEKAATQTGLDHSHLIEDEKAPNTFMHVTVWSTREDWVKIEQSPVHKEMHEKRNALLASPMEHDFVCGDVLA